MDHLRSLNHAFCEFICALSKTKGQLTTEDRKRLRSILIEEMKDLKGIIELVLARESMDMQISYLWVMRELRLNAAFLLPYHKERFARVIDKVANSFSEIPNNATNAANSFVKELKLT